MPTQAEPRPSSVAEQSSDIAAEVYAPRRVDVALRGLDLIIAGSALVVLSPLLGLLALATLLTSGRPVLYRGQRVGRAGQVFTSAGRTQPAPQGGATYPQITRGRRAITAKTGQHFQYATRRGRRRRLLAHSRDRLQFRRH